MKSNLSFIHFLPGRNFNNISFNQSVHGKLIFWKINENKSVKFLFGVHVIEHFG